MSLRSALDELLRTRLPGLFGGGAPAVTLAVERAGLTVEPLPSSAADAQPRTHDGLDELPFDPAEPAGPYVLSQSPATGPRRIWLQGDLGRIALQDSEIVWDENDPKRFELAVAAGRDLTGVSQVVVRYSVIAVRTTLQAVETVRILLAGEVDAVERAEALTLAVLALELTALTGSSGEAHLDGDYVAAVTTESIVLAGSAVPDAGGRALEIRARQQFAVGRILRDDEGQPIERVRTPGLPVQPGRPIDVRIDVDA